MEDADAEILVTVTGLEEITTQTVHARYSYSWTEILWDRRFADIFRFDDAGRRVDRLRPVPRHGTGRFSDERGELSRRRAPSPCGP